MNRYIFSEAVNGCINAKRSSFAIFVAILVLVVIPGTVTASPAADIQPVTNEMLLSAQDDPESWLMTDLTYIARTRSLQFIVESILNPRAHIAEEYELLTIVTKDGKEITGRKRYLYDHRGNKNTEVVQILDSSGKLWTTYFTKDLQSSRVPKAGVMPENYADILSVKQMHDLLAYLFTLK